MTDEEEVVREWAEHRAAAAALLRSALGPQRHAASPEGTDTAGAALRSAVEAGDPRVAWLARGAGIGDDLTYGPGMPMHPEDVLWALVAASIEPEHDPGLPVEEHATLLTLVPSDWVGALLGLVRAGPGSAADAETLVAHLDACPELEGSPLDPEDAELLAESFALRLPAWQVAGLVDDDLRLTEVGAWLLPRAACTAWGSDLDHPEEWADDRDAPDVAHIGDDPFGDDPLGEEPFDEDADELDAELDELLDAFEAWQERTGDGSDADELHTMLDLRGRLLDEELTRWDRDDLAVLFLEVAPHRLSVPGEEMDAALAAVASFLRHLDDEDRLHPDSDPVDELVAWLDHARPAVVEAMDDPSRWGPTKTLVGQMQAEGVDLTDREAVQDWIADFNTRPQEERDALLAGVGPASGLPTLVLPSTEELTELIRSTPLWRQVMGLMTYVGDRLPLTDAGNIKLADARRLVAQLDTGDVFDPERFGRQDRTRSSTELDGLTRTVELAEDVGLLDRDGRAARPVYDRLAAAREDPETLWRELVVAWLRAGILGRSYRHFRRPLWVQQLDGTVLDLLIALVERDEPLPLDRMAQVLEDELAEELGDMSTIAQEWITDDVHRFAERLEVAGLVEVTGTRTLPGRYGTKRRTRGSATVTTLGRLLLHRLAGAPAHRVGALRDAPAPELLDAIGELPIEAAEAEVAAWLEARAPEAAADDVATAVAGSGRERAMTASLVFDRIGPAAEAAVTRLTDDPVAGAFARSWLVHQGLAPLDPDAAGDDLDGMLGVLATLATHQGPDGVVEALGQLGDADDQIAFLDAAWRSSLEDADEVLGIVGDLHPDKAVRKAARKAAFKRRSAT